MPIVYVCKNCHYVVFVYPSTKISKYYGTPSPSELLKIIVPVCPRCHRPLEPPSSPSDVRLVPFSKKLLKILSEYQNEPEKLREELYKKGQLQRALRYGLITIENGGAHLTWLGKMYVSFFRCRLSSRSSSR